MRKIKSKGRISASFCIKPALPGAIPNRRCFLEAGGKSPWDLFRNSLKIGSRNSLNNRQFVKQCIFRLILRTVKKLNRSPQMLYAAGKKVYTENH